MDLNVLLVCTMPGGVADFGPIRGREISHHTPQRNDILAGAAQWAVPATTHSDILPEQWSHLLTQTLRWFSHIIQNPFQNRWIILAPPEKLREKSLKTSLFPTKGWVILQNKLGLSCVKLTQKFLIPSDPLIWLIVRWPRFEKNPFLWHNLSK